jgi:hypothetical protein
MTERKPSSRSKTPMDTNPTHPGRTEGTLSKDVQVNIGRQLSVLWEKDTKKPVPDEWVEMVQRLEQKEAAELLRRREQTRGGGTSPVQDDEDRQS